MDQTGDLLAQWRTDPDSVGPTGTQVLIRDLAAENDRLRNVLTAHAEEDVEIVGELLAERDRLLAVSARHWLTGEVARIARQLHRTGQHPAAIDLETAIEQAAALDTSETEGVVAQLESAPATAGTSAGSSPAHPHPYDNCTCCGHYRSEHDWASPCFIEDCGCADYEDDGAELERIAVEMARRQSGSEGRPGSGS